jgi:PAS domain S-box-containing protein
MSMNQPINLPALEQVIDRTPLTIEPDATALLAITAMHQPPANQAALAAIESLATPSQFHTYSCVLILEQSQPIGILTEYDIVRLTALGTNFAAVQVSAVMTQPIITLHQTNEQSVLTALLLLRQHHISHLPIVDEQGLLRGIVTEKDLLQLFDPLLSTKQQNIPIVYQQPELALNQQQQSQQDLTDFVENAIFALHWVAADGKIIWANQAELDLLGYTREEYIGHSITEFHADQDIIADILQRLLSNQIVQEYEADLRCKDGSIRRVLIDSNSSWRDGEFVRTRCFTRDITDRKRAAEDLERFNQALSHAMEGIALLDPQGKYVQINQAYAQTVGYTPESMLGMDWQLTVHPEDLSRMQDAYQQMLVDGKVEVAARGLRRDGSIFYKQLVMVTASDSNQQLTGHYCFMKDITKAKQAELDLQNQKQDLARSNAELQQFAYVASHDLQEPLRMITSYLELLERRYKGQLDDKADQFIAYAVDGATRMQILINDLLSYSRVGTSTQDWQAVDCEKIVQIVLSNLHLASIQSHAIITHDALPKVNADSSQMIQLFQNLISNAIKFRGEDPPQIHIGVDCANGKWLFSVQDNGIGMEVQYLDRIFIIFQRLHSKTEYPGTGIGLAVCKKIVERHGGNLWVESQPNEGATFYFTIPQIAGKL